jgi:hypothetical protein
MMFLKYTERAAKAMSGHSNSNILANNNPANLKIAMAFSKKSSLNPHTANTHYNLH